MDLLSPDIVPDSAVEFKQESKDFAEAYIEPNAEEYFEKGVYPKKIVQKGMEEGFVAQDISKEYGGKGLDLSKVLAMSEEFYRADAGISLSLQLPSFGTKIIEKYGSDKQKEEYLRPVAKNDMISGLAVSEPDTGSDMAGMSTRAEKDGDEWVLNGEKYWVGNGVEGDWLTVYAKTGDDPDNRYGNYSVFIVPTDSEGYDAEHIPEKMAYRASKQAHIKFDNCRIPEENIVGTKGAGFYMIAEFFNYGRIIVAGHGLGLAAAAIEEASDFVHNRSSFGRDISDFQSVQHDISDMRMEFTSARSLTWRAKEKVENGENPGYWAALAKTKATEVATDCAETAMQLHGGRSVLKENKISRIYTDVRVPVIYEGSNPIQRNLIYRQRPNS